MNSVMLSIKPKYCELIANGKKTIEVRKTRPKIETPFKCYIYCTKGKLALLRDDNDEHERYKFEHCSRADFQEKCGKTLLNGKVIGEFACDEIYQYTTCDVKDGVDISDGEMTRMSCLTKDEIMNYELSPGYFGVFGWHISDLVIYDNPKELSKFANKSSQFIFSNDGVLVYKGMTRPPQSWCYVEEIK